MPINLKQSFGDTQVGNMGCIPVLLHQIVLQVGFEVPVILYINYGKLW